VADQEDMSGLHLLRDGTATIVCSVDENSPAFTRGIRPQDLVESVDGQSTATLGLREIRRRQQSRDGDRVVLQIKRGDDLLNFEFKLKNAI
jgi:C-terminal processing protease CtpA/Prc